ncbi:MAG: dipeptidase [Filifactor alocis]|nr:dipeptidase [Filifactor alocis]
MNIIDMHCDSLLGRIGDKEFSLRENGGHLSLEKMKKAGGLAQFFAIFISREDMKTEDPYDFFEELYHFYLQELDKNKDLILPAFCKQDILDNQEKGRMSSILTIEDGFVIKDSINRIDNLFDKGVRLITLTWDFENDIGYPCTLDEEENKRGLKSFGFEVVQRMNEKGMIIDVSHLSEGGFYDVAKYSSKPFVASHSCAKALCLHRRNLTDHQLRTIGESGSLVGVNYYSAFLQDEGSYSSNKRIVEHIEHMAKHAGIEAVGLGSDFDGISGELEMKDYSGYPALIEEMRKTFTDDEVEKICYLNALRLIGDVMRK